MKHIGIQTACSENWNEMTPTDKGAFCQKCVKQVHDFTNKSTGEIKQVFREMMGQEICGRMTKDQELALNAEFEAWKFQSKQGFQRAMVFSLVVVFGLTLFSCTDEQDEIKVKEIQATAIQAINQQNWGTAPEISEVTGEKIDYANFQVPYTNAYVTRETEEIDYVVYGSMSKQQEPIVCQFINLNDLDSYTVGDIRISTRYVEYLVATETIQEYDDQGRLIPTEFSSIVYPNPATTETTFELAVPVTGQFEINLFDMNGKFIQSIHSGEIQRGTFQQQINLMDLNPGIYLVTIVSKDYKETVRISKI
jgi:hypothetical protein